MKTITLLALYLIGLTTALAQTDGNSQILKGKITAAKEQVQFATVGIAKENVGTITNEQGEFEIKIPAKYRNQLLTVSHIGYKPTTLSIDSLLHYDYVAIELIEKVDLLDEVIVTTKRIKAKSKEYGNTKKHELFIWIQNGDKGAEIVTLIDPKAEIALNSVSVNVVNQLEKEFTLLLNIYDMDSLTLLPGKQLLKNQKIIKSTFRKGWLDIDVSNENLSLTKPFYVGFQWVDVAKMLPLIGGKDRKSSKSLIRYNALGTWEQYAEWDIKVKGTVYKIP
jgi:hypothetical protein